MLIIKSSGLSLLLESEPDLMPGLATNLQNVEAGEDVFVLEEPHHLQLPEHSLRADEALMQNADTVASLFERNSSQLSKDSVQFSTQAVPQKMLNNEGRLSMLAGSSSPTFIS